MTKRSSPQTKSRYTRHCWKLSSPLMIDPWIVQKWKLTEQKTLSHLLSFLFMFHRPIQQLRRVPKKQEREHFCAESASILDRFVRLTDFERLTMVDKERICCSKLKGNETKRSYQKFGIPVMITMCNPINYGFLCNFSKTLLLPTTLAKKSISSHINTWCPNKFLYWLLLLKLGEGLKVIPAIATHYRRGESVGHNAARHQISFRRTAQRSTAGHGAARQNENYFRTFPKLAWIHTL